jgi:hypothetical protein
MRAMSEPTAAERIAWYENVRQRDRYMLEVAADLTREAPRRARIAARITAAVFTCIRALPDRLTWRIFRGYDTALDRPLAALVCRPLGHSWILISAGDPRRGLGHLVMCCGCSRMCNTDDPDAFHPGTRERRDFGAYAFKLDAAYDTARYLHPWPPREEVAP